MLVVGAAHFECSSGSGRGGGPWGCRGAANLSSSSQEVGRCALRRLRPLHSAAPARRRAWARPWRHDGWGAQRHEHAEADDAPREASLPS